MRASRDLCGKIRLADRRLTREIAAAMTKPQAQRDKRRLTRLIEQHNSTTTLLDAFDCGQSRGQIGQLAGRHKRSMAERIADAEARASTALANGNAAKERGEVEKAERWYAKAGRWLDEANRLRGWGPLQGLSGMTDGEVLTAVARSKRAIRSATTKAEKALAREKRRVLSFFHEDTDVTRAARDNALLRAERAYEQQVLRARRQHADQLDAIRREAGEWADLVPMFKP